MEVVFNVSLTQIAQEQVIQYAPMGFVLVVRPQQTVQAEHFVQVDTVLSVYRT